MSNTKTGYICIDPLSYFYLIVLLVEHDLIPERLQHDDIFALARTKGTELNTFFVSKVQLIMELGIEAYKLLIDVLYSGAINETYDLEAKQKDFSDDLMRFLYCTKYIYKINPDNPLGFVPNKHNVIDENEEGSVVYQNKKAALIRSDSTIKFDPGIYDELVNELNTEFLINTQAQTFVPVSKQLQDKILLISDKTNGKKQPITYITQFIIMNTVRYYNEHNQFPFVPYDIASYMLRNIGSTLHE